LGYNFRMTEIEGAIGLVQLKRLDEMNEARIRNAKTLDSGLRKISSSFVSPPYVHPKVKHVYHMYAPKFSMENSEINREILIEALRAEGVPVFAWQQMALQNQPVFKKLVPEALREKIRTPVADALCKSVLHMYIHPPNGDVLMNEYLEAFAKIYNNLGELGGMAASVKLRAPKDWGVPRES
jgi:perosamine synthetase